MGEESIDEAGQAVAGLVNMVMICYPLDPSGKLTQTLADRGWKTSCHTKNGDFQGPTVNLLEGMMCYDPKKWKPKGPKTF